MNVSFDDVQVCMIVKDEESFLASALPAIAHVFPAFAVLDQSSTDRTAEVAKDILGRRLVLITRDRDFVTRCGFSGARNTVSEQGTLPWLLHIDADERLRATDRITIEPSSGVGEICFAGITRRNLADLEPEQPLSDQSLADTKVTSVETHTRLYRRDAHLRWHSFIHEELWDATTRLTHSPPLSNLVLDHLSSLKEITHREDKEDLYSWMMIEGLSRTGTEEELSDYARSHALAAFDYHRERAARFARTHGPHGCAADDSDESAPSMTGAPRSDRAPK